MNDAAQAKEDVEADPAKYIVLMLSKMTEHDRAAFNFCVNEARWAQTAKLRAEAKRAIDMLLATVVNGTHGPTIPPDTARAIERLLADPEGQT